MNGICSYNNVLKGVCCNCHFKECKQEPGISERYILRQGVMPERSRRLPAKYPFVLIDSVITIFEFITGLSVKDIFALA